MNIRHWCAQTTVLALLGMLAPSMMSVAADAVPVERQIESLEQIWNDAYGANELPKYFGYYAYNPLLVFYNKRTTLAEYRKMWAEQTKTEPLESAKISDLKVQVAPTGDAAVASYLLDVRTRHPDGKITLERAFETDVWFKRNSEWRVYAVHYSAVSEH